MATEVLQVRREEGLEAAIGVLPEAVAWPVPGAHDRDGGLGEEGAGRRSAVQPQDALWEGFWRKHGDGRSPLDLALWLTRRLLARRHARMLTGYLRRMMPKDRIPLLTLEIGCGSAETSASLSRIEAGTRLYGVDRSRGAVNLARKRNPGLRCVVGDALALPFAPETFVLSFSSGVIEHFERREAARMVNEHWRVTGPRGTVAVVVPWKHSPYNLLRIMAGRHWPFGHERPFGRGELRAFIKAEPLSAVAIRSGYATTLLGLGTKVQGPSFASGGETPRRR